MGRIRFVLAGILIILFSCNKNVVGVRIKTFKKFNSIAVVKLTPSEQLLSKKLETIFSFRHKFSGFNGSVLVARKGRILFSGNYGYAQYENKKKLNNNSVFQLASASKPFTAMAILKLISQGKMALDDSIQKFIPDFPYKNITIKLLLTHRSGLPNYMYFMELHWPDRDTPIPNSTVVDFMLKEKPAKYFKPNRRFEYNNSNYMLLAYLVETVSGKSFNQFMEEEIFNACGMKNTFVVDKVNRNIKDAETFAYEGPRWKKVKDNYLDGVNGDKNVYSTAFDLFLFDRMLYSGKLIPKELVEESYIGRSREKYGNRNYGYGWRLIEEKKKTKIVYHNGWWHGYNSLFFRRPEDETLVVILGNKYNKIVYKIEDIICSIDEFCSPLDLEEQDENKLYADKEN